MAFDKTIPTRDAKYDIWLNEFADYIVLNVSSPNTPGLRELQGSAPLMELLSAIGEKNLITHES